MDYEIINHGYMDPDYFRGCGVAFTKFDYYETGVGSNAKEAYDDAVDKIYLSHDNTEKVDKLKLPKRPHGIRKSDKVPARWEDSMWYVSIRYTL
jgi:hypothetical protein